MFLRPRPIAVARASLDKAWRFPLSGIHFDDPQDFITTAHPSPQQLTYHPAAALRAASPTHSSSACSWCSSSIHWTPAAWVSRVSGAYDHKMQKGKVLDF
ncbi:hypothetical protein B0A54_02511 [Friedmanniomyces endolithicus]|uniref:Uncharacterized protein n=1 Tax=Friedmanniomyces endolithicus TaxID=329885 RepID=A0A4U0VDU8_9PEZI|nr:hypothetical protein B0A54_02511 [Friedmanniomyces endolithicus]